ncbi:hypothetical protein [Lachnospira multipara]|jgi:hypothetical protein|uniref:hypothetical protein n=1 Tax=Lachnospira multipara TaxID=28051 RepID=UPI0004884B95|nr:hypothetical protein [Lachnospira multipara]
MEIKKISITSEESKSYHNIIGRFKALNLVDWIKAYIVSVLYTVVICAAFYFLVKESAIYMWLFVPVWCKIVMFLVLLLIAAIQRSGNKQIAQLLNKYFINDLKEELITGKIQLKKVKVVKDKILVYYRKDNLD